MYFDVKHAIFSFQFIRIFKCTVANLIKTKAKMYKMVAVIERMCEF